MGDFLQAIVDAVEANQHLAYALVFMLSFFESLPVIGSIVPGTTIILAISAMVASGAIDIWWLLGSAILGAIGGDGFSYWLGFRFHREIGSMWPLNRYPQIIDLGQAAIEKHGGKSIFIARFTPAVRAVVPLVAGILRMNPWRFYFVNVVSAVAWAVSHIVPAVIAGASLAVVGAMGGRLLGLIVVLGVLLWLIFIIVRFAVRYGLPWLGERATHLWLWARSHDNWVSREILSALDPTYHEAKGLALLLIMLVASAWLFLGILKDVVAGDPLRLADQAVINFMQGLRSQWGDRAMIAVSAFSDALVTAAVTVAVLLWLAALRAWRAAIYWLGAFVFGAAFVQVLRVILHMPLPVSLDEGIPSEHAAITVTVYGFLALLVGRELGARSRVALATGTALLIALLVLARLYLGALTVTDVGAGLAFGIAGLAGLGIIYLSHRPQTVRGFGLLALFLTIFIVVGTLHATASFQQDVRRYAMRPNVVEMPASTWWEASWENMPARRIDLAGGLEEPITLQWAGGLRALKTRLVAKGWREPPKWTLTSTLAWLQPSAGVDDLPVLMRLHAGRPERLNLILTGAGGDPRVRFILRIWRSNVMLTDTPDISERLWLGAVVTQRLYHVGALFTVGMSVRDENAARATLEEALAPVRIVHRQAEPDSWGWNGWVLLAHQPNLSLPAIEKRVEP